MSMAPKAIPRAIPLEVLESCPDSCFALSESLDITYCNAAWNTFALANHAGPEVLGARVISRNLLEFVPDELKAFHAGLFAKARTLGQPVSHDYECSSATHFRLYRMQIYPLADGFAVINSLRVEHPHDRTPLEPNEALYRNSAGLIRMCSNCRRANRANDPAAWDWVPDYVVHMRENTTHGVCPACLEYYYRPYLQT
jgi:hypothetical protein